MKKTLGLTRSKSGIARRTVPVVIAEKLNYFFDQLNQFFGVRVVLSLIAKLLPSVYVLHGSPRLRFGADSSLLGEGLACARIALLRVPFNSAAVSDNFCRGGLGT
jgi:hypothetical protein